MTAPVALTAVGLVCLTVAAVLFGHRAARPPRGPVAREDNSFAFEVHAPYADVAPLFGAWAERAWAGPDWTPDFVYPQPARDEPGAVFTLAHGKHDAIWLNTAFDLTAGVFQYVYVIPSVLTTAIDIRAEPAGPALTRVRVHYRRTALDSRHNARVAELGAHDRAAGPEWASQLEAALAPHP
jgi:hypothetical protein